MSLCVCLQVIVLESSSRFGGWLWSTRRSDGAVFEHGPRGIRPAGGVGHNTLNMVSSTVVTMLYSCVLDAKCFKSSFMCICYVGNHQRSHDTVLSQYLPHDTIELQF